MAVVFFFFVRINPLVIKSNYKQITYTKSLNPALWITEVLKWNKLSIFDIKQGIVVFEKLILKGTINNISIFYLLFPNIINTSKEKWI